MDTKRQIVVGVALFGVFLMLWFGVRALIHEQEEEGTQGTSVFLYYYDESKDTDSKKQIRCSSRGLVPVTRSIKGDDPIAESIALLLKGELTDADRTLGVKANFPITQFTFVSADLDAKGVLTLEFSDPRHNSSGGSCRVNILRAQIEATARQFDGVVQVRYMPQDILQP
ncbi:MAG: GerMN domain-containing protein [Candidatus Pacebacteria bacterium]|nr:GerMN domain-containing protein [Candidatus Paceibacterota bacterium]